MPARAGAAVLPPPRRGQFTAGVQRLFGLAGEQLAGVHSAGLDVAEVGGAEPHLGGELFLRQPALLAPPGQLGAERRLLFFPVVRAHCRTSRPGGWPERVSEPRVSAPHRRLTATGGGVLRL